MARRLALLAIAAALLPCAPAYADAPPGSEWRAEWIKVYDCLLVEEDVRSDAGAAYDLWECSGFRPVPAYLFLPVGTPLGPMPKAPPPKPGDEKKGRDLVPMGPGVEL